MIISFLASEVSQALLSAYIETTTV